MKRRSYERLFYTIAIKLATGKGSHPGATPLDSIQEFSEGISKHLRDQAGVPWEKQVQWIRDTEAFTKRGFLQNDLSELSEPLRHQAIDEAFSSIAVGYATGRIMETQVPSSLRSFLKAFKQTLGHIFSLAKDIKAYSDSGTIDPEFKQYLDLATGFSEDSSVGKPLENLKNSNVTNAQTSETTFSLTSKDALHLQQEILEQPATELSTEGIPTSMTAKEVVAYAVENGFTGETRHDVLKTNKNPTGEAFVGRSGIKHAVSQTLHTEKLAVLGKMKTIIPSSIFIDTFQKKGNLISYRFAAKVSVDGKNLVARIVVDSDHNGNRYYNHELSDLEGLSALTKSPQSHQKTGSLLKEASLGNVEIEDTYKLLQFIFSVNENDVKTTTQENSNPESTETTSTTNESSPSSSQDSEDPNIMHERKSKIDERTYSSLQEKFRALAKKIYQSVIRRASRRGDGSPPRKGVNRSRHLFASTLTLTPEERKILASPYEIMLVHDADGRLDSVLLGDRYRSPLPSNIAPGAILTHNHPGGRGPSSSDILQAFKHPQATFRIVTTNEKNQVEVFQMKANLALDEKSIKRLIDDYADSCNSLGDTPLARRKAFAFFAKTHQTKISTEISIIR